MCTALSYTANQHYFGRNLDLERGYSERVVITPRNFSLEFRNAEPVLSHYAMIGMAAVVNDYPLYFEATNEKGLSIAGLNFPQNAVYYDYQSGKENIAPFELIPFLLSRYATVNQVRKALENINIINLSFSKDLSVTPLHWLIADSAQSVTLECTNDGMKIFDNPFGVLTNNPPFDFHLTNINNYMGLHEGFAENKLSSKFEFENYSLGLGALGLPGDYSSASRFVRAVFVKEKSVCEDNESSAVNQFFHILQSVAMPKGCVLTASGEYEYTRYSSCCNTDTLTYYYTTYEDMSVKAVELNSIDLSLDRLMVVSDEL